MRLSFGKVESRLSQTLSGRIKIVKRKNRTRTESEPVWQQTAKLSIEIYRFKNRPPEMKFFGVRIDGKALDHAKAMPTAWELN